MIGSKRFCIITHFPTLKLSIIKLYTNIITKIQLIPAILQLSNQIIKLMHIFITNISMFKLLFITTILNNMQIQLSFSLTNVKLQLQHICISMGFSLSCCCLANNTQLFARPSLSRIIPKIKSYILRPNISLASHLKIKQLSFSFLSSPPVSIN